MAENTSRHPITETDQKLVLSTMEPTDANFGTLLSAISGIENPEDRAQRAEEFGQEVFARIDSGEIPSSVDVDDDFTPAEKFCMTLGQFAMDVPTADTFDAPHRGVA